MEHQTEHTTSYDPSSITLQPARQIADDARHRFQRIIECTFGECPDPNCADASIEHMSSHIALFAQACCFAGMAETVQEIGPDADAEDKAGVLIGLATVGALSQFSNFLATFVLSGIEAAVMDPEWAEGIARHWINGRAAGLFSGEMAGMDFAKVPALMIEHLRP